MSGKKVTEVTIQKDQQLDMDSGCCSGSILEFSSDLSSRDPIELVEYSAELSAKDPSLGNVTGASPKPKDEKKGNSEVSLSDLNKKYNSDSGVISDLVESFNEVSVEELERLKPLIIVDLKSDPTPAAPVPNSPQDNLFNPDNDGDTQLHIAAVHGLEKPVSTLIRLCPNKALLNLANDHGLTALHLAVMSQNRVITRMLVRSGADLGIRDRRGETPLHKATIMADVKCIHALLMPVDNIQRKIPSINQKNYNGQACVHIAASMGHHEALQTLLHYKADVNSNENLAGRTALHIAAARGDVRMVSLLQRHAGTAPRARDYAGRSPRRLARHTRAADLFTRHADSDSDTDDDDDMYDEEAETFFEIFSKQGQTILA